jgi:hypothetical protein
MVDKASGKAWLDAAKRGALGEMQSMHARTPELLSWRQPGIGNSALHWAAARNHEVVLQWLLDTGIDADIENGSGGTALHTAASNDCWEAVNLLLKGGTNAAATDEDGQTVRPHAPFCSAGCRRFRTPGAAPSNLPGASPLPSMGRLVIWLR